MAKLVPSAVTDNGTAAELSFGFVEWLSSPILFLDDTVQDMFIYKFVIGLERMGTALDAALAKIRDDSPRSTGVLRAQLRNVVACMRADGGAAADSFKVQAADTYEVAYGGFPTGAGIDDVYDWMGALRGRHLVTAAGGYGIYGDISRALSDRFDPAVALVVGGPFEMVAKGIMAAVPADEGALIADLPKSELAAELSAWLRRVLPIPDELAEYAATRTSALLALLRLLKDSSSGEAILVTPANIVTVIEHHEAARLVIGNNVGGTVALNMVVEILRLALNSPVKSVALGQLATGMAALADLLPALRSDVIYTVARAREGVGRTWGITATSRAPGAAHLGHHRTQGRPQVRLSQTESGYTVPQAGRVGRL